LTVDGTTERLTRAGGASVIVTAIACGMELLTRPVPVDIAVLVTTQLPPPGPTVVIVGLAPVASTVQRAELLPWVKVGAVAPGLTVVSVVMLAVPPFATIATLLGVTVKVRSALGAVAGPVTSTAILALILLFAFEVAVTVVLPGDSPLTTPAALIEAIPLFEELQVTPRSIVPVPPFVATVADTCASCPSASVRLAGVTVTLVTAIVSTATGSSSLQAVRVSAVTPSNSSERLRTCILFVPPRV
jgi:hypothetical protein